MERLRQPSSRASTLLTALLRAFNPQAYKCTGVCRFVHGIPAGISRRVVEVRGFLRSTSVGGSAAVCVRISWPPAGSVMACGYMSRGHLDEKC